VIKFPKSVSVLTLYVFSQTLSSHSLVFLPASPLARGLGVPEAACPLEGPLLLQPREALCSVPSGGFCGSSFSLSVLNAMTSSCELIHLVHMRKWHFGQPCCVTVLGTLYIQICLV
jgi:hypothetical protein